MLRYIAIGFLLLSFIGSYGWAYKLGGDHREAGLKAEKYSADNQILMAQARTMVNSFKQTSEGLKGLSAIHDETLASDSVGYAIDRVCQQRKSAGVRCPATKPAVKAIP